MKRRMHSEPRKLQSVIKSKKKQRSRQSGRSEEKVWKWWKKKNTVNNIKWRYLKHKGPLFPPLYKPLPGNVKLYYNGEAVRLSKEAEEVASLFAKMINEKITSKPVFRRNFFNSWREVMKPKERKKFTDLEKCNFGSISSYYKKLEDSRRQQAAGKRLILKKQENKLMMKYGHCLVDRHIQKIGNFKVEPPGLFRGRGNHPKMGLLKKRIFPADVTINISKGVAVPKPHCGGKWKKVIHDNTVTWLACWTDNITNSTKYMRLSQASKITGESDLQKYELARLLDHHLPQIRERYFRDMKSKDESVKEKAVALYLIDELALRVGSEKKEDTADTVGCCSLRVEHVRLHSLRHKKCVELDFLGKDSVRYRNTAQIPKVVYDNLKSFMQNKKQSDKLFSNTTANGLNKYLSSMMPGLTAKVFRTYHASELFELNLDHHTKANMSLQEKIHVYHCANRDVAVLCNHCRKTPEKFQESVRKMHQKINVKTKQVRRLSQEVKEIEAFSSAFQKKVSKLCRCEEQLKKLLLQAVEKVENKELAIATSKLNYIDPRITVAWCKRWNVPVEKIYNKSQREKFQWAIETAESQFRF